MPGACAKLARDQKGQTTIFLGLAMMVLVCFLAFVVDLGQLVHERILTQSAADLIALSAANTQAVGLNEIADLNMEYKGLEDDLYIHLLAGIWTSAGDATNLVEFFKEMMGRVRQLQDGANTVFALNAHAVAARVLAWFNREHGGDRPFVMVPLIHPRYPGSKLTAIEPRQTSFGAYLAVTPMLCCQLVTKTFVRFRPLPFSPGSATGIPTPGVASWDSYLNKDDRVAAYYRVLVYRPPGKAFVNLPAYGFDVGVPGMYAMSLAMPTGGNVEKCEPKYVARFAPAGTEFQFDVTLPFARQKFLH